MHLPISFRVISMLANEATHEITIIEARPAMEKLPVNPTAHQAPAEVPRTILTVKVSPEQFRAIRVGMTYNLEPSKPAPAPNVEIEWEHVR